MGCSSLEKKFVKHYAKVRHHSYLIYLQNSSEVVSGEQTWPCVEYLFHLHSEIVLQKLEQGKPFYSNQKVFAVLPDTLNHNKITKK